VVAEILSSSVAVSERELASLLVSTSLMFLAASLGVRVTIPDGALTVPARLIVLAVRVTEPLDEVTVLGTSRLAAKTEIDPAIVQSLCSFIPAVVFPDRPMVSPPKLEDKVIPAVFSWKTEKALLDATGKKLAVPDVLIVVPKFPVPSFVILSPTIETFAVEEVTRLLVH
jgi:hypothetical protein